MNVKRTFPILVIVCALILSACGGVEQTQPATEPEEPGKPAAPVVLRIGWLGVPIR